MESNPRHKLGRLYNAFDIVEEFAFWHGFGPHTMGYGGALQDVAFPKVACLAQRLKIVLDCLSAIAPGFDVVDVER